MGIALNRGKKDDANMFKVQILNQHKEELEHEEEEIVPWLVDSRTSKFYKIWSVVITIMLQVELFFIPLALVYNNVLD